MSVIDKALEQIEGGGVMLSVQRLTKDSELVWPSIDATPLAALIRQHEDGRHCGCDSTNWPDHAPDCALIALCAAIAGEARKA